MTKVNKTDKKSKNSNSLLIITAAVVFCVAVGISLVAWKKNNTTAEVTDNKTAQVIEEGESLVIPISDISTTVSFYPVKVEGTLMEVIAVMDSDGNIRTAFNTCQICYGSGRGYYVQDGDVLVCQNCGNRFTIDEVEIQTGGCNPLPIFAENKTVTDDTIEISYDFLNKCRQIFANWKA